jgi:hypothetical protein
MLFKPPGARQTLLPWVPSNLGNRVGRSQVRYRQTRYVSHRRKIDRPGTKMANVTIPYKRSDGSTRPYFHTRENAEQLCTGPDELANIPGRCRTSLPLWVLAFITSRMALPGMANLARKYRGELNENMSAMRSERYSACCQSCERPTLLSQMLWPSVADFHGALCADS